MHAKWYTQVFILSCILNVRRDLMPCIAYLEPMLEI